MWLKLAQSKMSNDFERQIDRIVHIASQQKRQQQQPVVIGIVATYGKGKSAGAGKSILTQKIKSALEDRLGVTSNIVNTDAFLLQTPDAKKTLASRLLEKTITTLKSGTPVRLPQLNEGTKQGLGVQLTQSSLDPQEVAQIWQKVQSDPTLLAIVQQYGINEQTIETLIKMKNTDYSINQFLLGNQEGNQDIYDYVSTQLQNIKPDFQGFKDYGDPIQSTGLESPVVEPADFILLEGIAIYPAYAEIDIIVIGMPNEQDAQRGYARRWAAYKCEEYYSQRQMTPTKADIARLLALGWVGAHKLPSNSPLNALVKKDFINKYIPNNENDFDNSIDELEKLGKVITIKDYSPMELFNDINNDGDISDYEDLIDEVDKEFGEMYRTIETNNPNANSEFDDAQKTISNAFDKAKFPAQKDLQAAIESLQHSIETKTALRDKSQENAKITRIQSDIDKLSEELRLLEERFRYLEENKLFGRPIFKHGSDKVFITGGLNRDAIAQSGRQPQDFDLLYVGSGDDDLEFTSLVNWMKTGKKPGIDSVKIRQLRKSKALIVQIGNSSYEINLKSVSSELDVVDYCVSQCNFTFNALYRPISQNGDTISIIDTSGKGAEDLRDRIIRWCPAHDFSHQDETNSQNAVSAFLNQMKLANMAHFNEQTGRIEGLFTFDKRVSQEISRIMQENFPQLPAWKARHTLEKDIPEELERIMDPRIKQHFQSLIDNHPFFMQLKKRASE